MNQEVETWKEIGGELTKYEVSDLGRVRHKRFGIKKIKMISGNSCVEFTADAETRKVVRNYIDFLVASAFVDNDDPVNKLHVEHINNDRSDCKAINLVWVARLGDMHDNTGEIWKNIDGFSRYDISNKGRVRNVKTGKLLKIKSTGVTDRVGLINDKDKDVECKIYLLVAKAFVENDDPAKKIYVEHIDQVKTNNAASNLAWVEQLGEMHNHIEGEVWMPITAHSSYHVSNMGRVRVRKTGLILKQSYGGDYHTVDLNDDLGDDDDDDIDGNMRTTYLVHRLVALHFVENDDPKIKIKVDHIDNNKLNNNSSNLRWCTQSQNMKYHAENFREYVGRRITQLDLDHNQVRIWTNIKEIMEGNPDYCYNTILRRVSDGGNSYNHYWEYTDIAPMEVEKDEVFKKIGVYKNMDFSQYEISNYGKVKTIKGDRYMSPSIVGGYYHLKLSSSDKKSSTVHVHILVAHVFVKGRTSKKIDVNHIDEDRLNNKWTNLEWATVQDNTIHSVGRAVQQIDPKTDKVINTFRTVTEAYKHFGKSCNSHISRCCSGKEKICMGYKWKYIDE